MDVGRVLGAGFGSVFRNLGGVFATCGVGLLPSLALQVLVAMGPDSDLDLQPQLGFLAGAALADWLLPWFAMALAMPGLDAALAGRRFDVGACWGRATSSALPLLGAATVLGVCTLLGYGFCCVPGLMVSAAWFLVLPAIAVERLGFRRAFSRNGRLVTGVVSGLFVLALVAFLVRMGANLALAGLGSAVHPLVGAAAGWCGAVFSAACLAGFQVAALRARREALEGPDTERLAEIFD